MRLSTDTPAPARTHVLAQYTCVPGHAHAAGRVCSSDTHTAHRPPPAPPLFPLTAATEGNGKFCRESAWSGCLRTGALPGSIPAMPTLSRGAGSGVRGAGCCLGRLAAPPPAGGRAGRAATSRTSALPAGSWPPSGRAAGDGKRAPAWKGMKGGSQLRTPDATCPGAREGSGMSLLPRADRHPAEAVRALRTLSAHQAAEEPRGPTSSWGPR